VRNALIIGGVAVVAYFILTRKAAAAGVTTGVAGFGQPGFVQPATPSAPVTVVGCSFVRAGSLLLDANTGKEISEAEAQRRAKAEGCTVPPKPATKPGQQSIFVGGK
jgi:hypothetical protein